MGQADLSSMGAIMKPMLGIARKLASAKDRKKAEVKAKIKASVKVKRG